MRVASGGRSRGELAHRGAASSWPRRGRRGHRRPGLGVRSSPMRVAAVVVVPGVNLLTVLLPELAT